MWCFWNSRASTGCRATGGADFYGENELELQSGTGRAGNLHVPDGLWERLQHA
jgi:hypothetical protein